MEIDNQKKNEEFNVAAQDVLKQLISSSIVDVELVKEKIIIAMKIHSPTTVKATRKSKKHNEKNLKDNIRGLTKKLLRKKKEHEKKVHFWKSIVSKLVKEVEMDRYNNEAKKLEKPKK